MRLCDNVAMCFFGPCEHCDNENTLTTWHCDNMVMCSFGPYERCDKREHCDNVAIVNVSSPNDVTFVTGECAMM